MLWKTSCAPTDRWGCAIVDEPIKPKRELRFKWLGHLRTITKHKLLVARYCFRVGLYWQGICHDLSKYLPTEFLVGARYYTGTRSPNELERLEIGYSRAWLHHKGHNKHHLEYWVDYDPKQEFRFCGVKMPLCYLVEMFCDRIAASRIYRGNLYTDNDPYAYYAKSSDHYLLHPETRRMLEHLLQMLRDQGEEKTFAYIRWKVLENR